MAYKVTILDGAINDLDIALAWYGEISKELSADLLKKFESGVKLISESPLQFQKQKGNSRFYVIKRFPYKVVYKILANEIVVVAVAHHKRKKLYWKSR